MQPDREPLTFDRLIRYCEDPAFRELRRPAQYAVLADFAASAYRPHALRS